MKHLENHPHAFIGSDNVVVNVLAYESHDEQLINDTKIVQEEVFGKTLSVVDCCIEGWANVEDTFVGIGRGFRSVQPFPSWTLNSDENGWNPPIPCPTPTLDYYWSEDDLNWIKF